MRTTRSCSTNPMVGGASDEVAGAGGASAFESAASNVRSAVTAALVARLARHEQVGLHAIGERRGHER